MIVLSTGWYILKSKFNKNIYSEWINNFLSNVNKFKLVIYTNKESLYMIEPYESNPNIKIVLLEIEDFYNYKYKDYWIKNHEKNHLLNTKICWELNMLWSEKLSFVKKTIDENYFEGDWFGWCDIGYFRGKSWDISDHLIKEWPNLDKVSKLDKSKIYYARVNNNDNIMNYYTKLLLDKDYLGLPKNPIPDNQISIAGGFFLIYNTKIEWWHTIFDNKLKLYFENNRLVKDDQMIIIDCIVTNISNFYLLMSAEPDDWFLFQKYLL
tara:strand:+ start:508 stop:1305 length:798 start_codon:yes stop_codon:yes gene_type:complete